MFHITGDVIHVVGCFPCCVTPLDKRGGGGGRGGQCSLTTYLEAQVSLPSLFNCMVRSLLDNRPH